MIAIRSKADLKEAARYYGILPFFRNEIRGLSVEEMTPSGLLFGGNEYEGCWEWKGPVIRSGGLMYGKFFKRKAGFVSEELLPYFLKLRRTGSPIKPMSTDEMIYDIISINDRMTSTDLRETMIGKSKRRTPFDLPEIGPVNVSEATDPKFENHPSRHSLEGPLQRLQMGGWLCISDFKYKTTRKGERYGWGVAEYSTPEDMFGKSRLECDLTPEESMEFIIEYVRKRLHRISESQLRKLLIFK